MRRRKYRFIVDGGVPLSLVKARLVSLNCSVSINDCSIFNCNRRLKVSTRGDEVELWRIVNDLGVECLADEERVISRPTELEQRDAKLLLELRYEGRHSAV